MARTVIPVTGIPALGVARPLVVVGADPTNGLSLANPGTPDRRTIVLLQNSDASAKTVTIRSIGDPYTRIGDTVVTVPARASGFDGVAVAGPFARDIWNAGHGQVVEIDTAALSTEVTIGGLLISATNQDPDFGAIPFTPFSPAPAHYWPTTEIAADEIADTGIVGGSPLEVSGTGLTIVDGAMRFASDAAAMATSATSIAGLTGTPTVTAWFYFDEPADSGAMIQLATFASHIYAFQSTGPGFVDVGYFNGDPVAVTGATGAWVLIALRLIGSSTSVSINGGAFAGVSGGGDPSSEPLVFASDAFGLPRLRNASIKNPAMWTTTLTVDQVAALYARGHEMPVI